MLSIKVGDIVKTVTIQPQFVCSSYKGSFETKWYHEWIVKEIDETYDAIFLEDKNGNELTTDLNGKYLNQQIYKINKTYVNGKS